MRSKFTAIGMVAVIGVAMLTFSGSLMAGEQDSGSKACSHGASKVEGKCCNPEMCKKIQDHQAALNTASEKMAEHLDAMREIRSDKEWRQEMETHMAMLQSYLEEMSNCPMEDMMHSMMHGKSGEMGSGSK